MLELPEALVMARQLNETVRGKKIASVIAAHTAHKLAWYNGDSAAYPSMLTGETIGEAQGRGAMVEVRAGRATLLFSDGVNLRFRTPGDAPPERHQLLLEFEDGSSLSTSVQMYGGVVCFMDGIYDNKYYRAAVEKPAALSPSFHLEYFLRITDAPESQRLSLKALLATEQRIPGVGNGVLQDLLFNARMHPKRRVSTMVGKDKRALYRAIRKTLADMERRGGRDTERDLLGNPGGYATVMSSKNAGKPCPACGTAIRKEAYLGGSVYYCERCQVI
ncbi:MAG: endonuclease VIII [Spirochaetes bacterium]|nr:endonuclease VIII [Spirochaetota bacterium]